MRKSLAVLLSLSCLAIGLSAVALAGNLSERVTAAALLVAGISVIAFRKGIVLWAHSVGAESRLLNHWQLLRPLTVILAGSGLILLAGITFFEAMMRA